jgi:hypothetical protein
MASTWSSLKIQLMGAGDEGGTWGTVTNANLGTVIEEAITGSSNVTFASADVTLTLTDTTASQTARNLRLNLTGTSGGARNLIVPAIEKVYIVNNGVADTVTVKNSTGSGIAVPSGKTMYVFNNGTDVVDAITHLTSLTLGSALPIASGGTGSTTAAFSGENITSLNASNISSGTLANARTTASSSNGANTIVSRGASGEFSAGAITADGSGITALNASNVSTGTLAVARGGTGAATLTANNVILGNGTSAVQFVAPSTSGNVLTSNGTTWTSAQGFVTGMIMLWSGSIASIPSGWALCNGSSGTPDLRNRFIVGAGNTYAVAATGGSTDAIVVSHTHTATSSVTDSGHTHSVSQGGYAVSSSTPYPNIRYSDTSGGSNSTASQTTGSNTTGISVSTTVASAGSSGTNANLPPYYALAYIMKL